MSRPSLTGRDSFILAEALAYAIVTIAALPRERRSESNAEDMRILLADRVGAENVESWLTQVRMQTGWTAAGTN
jgi:hypothetical protein